MDLPLRKGVSSSAAICILVARAFNETYRLNLFPHELMELAYLGEKLTGSQCGRMDQACIHGKTPVLLTFSSGRKVQIEPMFPRRAICMFFVDLAARKDTVRILHDLQQAYVTSESIRRALGEVNERNVRRAFTAVQQGDAQSLGMLMAAAQADFDRLVGPHCPEELASPVLHDLLQSDFIRPHVYGGKGVGSQGDGVAQFVARSAADRNEAMHKIEQALPQMKCFPLTINPINAVAHRRSRPAAAAVVARQDANQEGAGN
jgi:galactokinase